jgi:hypothetical protein
MKTLRPLADADVNSLVGLRRLMKRLLRGYGLKCVKAEELADGIDESPEGLPGRLTPSPATK